MKKLLLLFAVLLSTVGAWAQVTKFYKPGERLSTLESGQKVMFYNTTMPSGQDRTGFLTDNGSGLNLVKSKPASSPIFSEKVGVWTIELATLEGSIYTVNVKGSNGYLNFDGKTNNASAQVLLFHEWTTAPAKMIAEGNSETVDGTQKAFADIDADDKVWMITNANQSKAWNGNQATFTTWDNGHPYAVYSVVEATTAELETFLATAKTNAVNELTSLKKVSSIFTTAEAAIANVSAVALENNDLETALSTINTLVAGVKAEVDGKNVKFCNKATDGRGGRYLGYDKANSRFAAVMSDDDNVVWTLKAQDNGTFKLYNAANNVWLGLPDRPAGAVETETNATAYTFVVTNKNVVCLVPSGTSKMVHVANDNNANYPVMNYYSTTDAASLWDVTVISNKEVTNASYTTFTNSKESVLDNIISYAKQLQDNYGLVKDGANIEVVINHPDGSDSQPSSNLLDGNNGTFVHSSYATGANAVTYHYIKAHLSEAKQKVFFYLSKRNNNNRPLRVKVYASNDGETFPETPAATLIMTESQDNSIQSYFTEAVDLGAAYEYLKFEVVNTNGGTQYFTLSEFYVLPVLEETTKNVSDLTSTSVFANEFDACLDAAEVYYSTLRLPDLKKEIQEFLDANKSNIQPEENLYEKPALGQYPYEYYYQLDQVINGGDINLGDLQFAFEAFKKSKNLPVFVITGPIDYVVGKSIYDTDRVNAKGNTLYFKTTNYYDKTMWWALDITETKVGASHLDKEIALYNVGTGQDFWNSSIKFTETNENDGAGIADDDIFLMYTTSDASYPVHFQADGALMTRWGSYEATSASAMKFVYVGESYDLKNLPASLFAAAAELAAVSVPNYTFSDGLNAYDPATKPALDEAIANRTTVLSKLSTAAEIAAAKTQLETAIAGVKINMPVGGRFYRLRCTGAEMKYLQCTQNTDPNRFDMISGSGGSGTTVNATFCYYNGGLVAYMKPLYINHDSNNASFKMEKTNVTFSEATGEPGQYFINVGGRYLYGDGNTSDSGAGTPNSHAGYRWWLENVTELPVTITAAKYATFFAPCNVTLPEELTAYVVSKTGNGYATLTEIDGKFVPANTGVLLYADVAEPTTYNLTIGGEATEVSSMMSGTVASSYITEDSYVLSKPADSEVGFYKASMNQQDGSAFLNNGFKAYLPKPEGTPDAARFFVFDFGGNETGIDELEGENGNVKTEIYDLAGRRVQNAQKGVFIVNGKVVIK